MPRLITSLHGISQCGMPATRLALKIIGNVISLPGWPPYIQTRVTYSKCLPRLE